MNPELDFLLKSAPAIGSIVGVIVLIAYTKKTLFQGMISKETFDAQLERERDFVGATKEAAAHLEEIGRQLEGISKKVSEDIREMGDRMRSLELVFSDNIDAIRELAGQWERFRKNIPETEVHRIPRRKLNDNREPKKA